ANGEYKFVIDVQHIVSYYDTINTIATSGSQVGQASSLAAKLISWKSPANEWSAVRNYVFTISDAAFMPEATLSVDVDNNKIALGETANLTATTNWSESSVVWTTSDASVATVENGVVSVTGENWGEVTITATVADKKVDTLITVKAPTQLEVDFAADSKELVAVGNTTTLVATTDWNANRVEWSTSDETVATVVGGVVTGVKGGEVTITATLGDLSVEKTVYVVGGLSSDQIGMRIGGYQYHDKPAYFNMAVSEDNTMTITAQFSDSAAYYPMLMFRNMYSKEYYQVLLENGYTKLTFMLGVSGANAADVSDLYVFGKKLTSFPKNASGAYAVVVDVEHIATYYDNIYGIATSGGQAGQSGSLDKMFIAWKSPLTWSGSRNYVFTISNMAFNQGVLFADNIGMRVNGWNMTTNTTYMAMDVAADGAITITANWQAYVNYGPALVLKNLESKAYYQGLIDSGYTHLTFDLQVGGEDADKLDDIHILGSAQKVSACEQVGGVYKVQIQLAHITQFYETITTLDTSANQAGQWGSRSALLLAWRFSSNFATVPADATRNYVFTISNTAYATI
ncbi:MAG: Ig-like domain-containing protein, partial [Clostridia bacterium]|nr:Ig-like domain-containing protein [Clostridia bacterium]